MTEGAKYIPLRDRIKMLAAEHTKSSAALAQEATSELESLSDSRDSNLKIGESRSLLNQALQSLDYITDLDKRISEIRVRLRERIPEILPENMDIEVVVFEKPPQAVQGFPDTQGQASGNSEDVNKDLKDDGGTPIEDLNLSIRAYNGLHRSGILTVEQLLKTPEEKLQKIRNFGFKSITEVQEKLTKFSSQSEATN